MKKIKKWLYRLIILIGLLPFAALGVFINRQFFFPNNTNQPYYDSQFEAYVGSPYIVDTLHLNNSRLLNALQNKVQPQTTHYSLNNEALTNQVTDFLEGYSPNRQYETDDLKTLKSTVEELLENIYQYIRDFNGQDLTTEDKHHYRAVYTLRKIDREITHQLRKAGIEEETFFQKPALVKDGQGHWILSIQKPESEHLQGYYNLILKSDFIHEIIKEVNTIFSFSNVHTISFLERGKNNIPIYDRKTKNINISYEEFAFINRIFQEDLKSQNEINTLIMDVVGVICLREFGHAFLDIYDVPYTGKIEDSVDQLAVVLVAEVFNFSWELIQRKIMAYAKTLYRINEIMEEGTTITSLHDINISREEIENQSILLLNDNYDSSFLLGKQRFYAILNMLVGFHADLYTPYMLKNIYDLEYYNNLFPAWNIRNPLIYFRASNYWYNSLKPYFRYGKRES